MELIIHFSLVLALVSFCFVGAAANDSRRRCKRSIILIY